MTGFADAIRAAGLEPPEHIEPGRLHRFPGQGKRNGNRAGWCKLFPDGQGGVFGDWSTGLNEVWQACRNTPMTEADRADFASRVEESRRQAEAERQAAKQEAAERARREWDAAQPASSDHPYLVTKQVSPHGIRQDDDGRLIVPVRDPDGHLAGLQYIDGDGGKRFSPGTAKRGAYHSIGAPQGTLVVAEGYATAASVHEATGYAVAAAFDAGNLRPVAEALRAKYPEARILIAADHDSNGIGQEKATDAAQAVGGTVALPPEVGDFNDYAAAHGPEGVRSAFDAALHRVRVEPIAADEWTAARLTPDTIVENHLYADVGVFVAPGGMGKTTMVLHEAVHIPLALPLYGLKILRPGPVVILTAEDSREMLVARLRRIAESMGLTPAQIEQVRRDVRILDVSGTGTRLTEVRDDVVVPSPYVGELADALRELEPSLVTIDPAVSFGVGESRVNDAEQGLIEAGRRLRRALNCCVRYIHHSGKQNGRDKATDQYAGRGGSAFADGARMVHVLQSVSAADWHKATRTELEPGDNGLILARPKMSYCAPQDPIYIRRRGYRFDAVPTVQSDPLAALERDAQTLLHIINTTEEPTQNMLVAMDTGLSRDRTRTVVHHLVETGRAEYRESKSGRGGKRKYLVAEPHTARPPIENADSEDSADSADWCAAALREGRTRTPKCGPSPHDPLPSGRTPAHQTAQPHTKPWGGDL